MLTSGKHALDEVVYIAEDDSETLWGGLLPRQRFDLNALQYWLCYSSTGIHVGIEYRSRENVSAWRIEALNHSHSRK